MNKPIYILGAGGHAKVLLDCINNNAAGFLEINPSLIGKNILHVPILSEEIIFKKYTPDQIELINGIGSTSLPVLRQKQFLQYQKLGFYFLSVFHKTSYYSRDVVFGAGVQLLANSVVLTGSVIGNNVIINTATSVDHDCVIGDHVHIAPGCTVSGGVTIESGCHIGTGAKIIQGVTIGKNTLVAAGTVVVHNVPAQSRVAGIPAKLIEG